MAVGFVSFWLPMVVSFIGWGFGCGQLAPPMMLLEVMGVGRVTPF